MKNYSHPAGGGPANLAGHGADKWQPIATAPDDTYVLVRAPTPDADGLQTFVARKETWQFDGEHGVNWEGPYADFYSCVLFFEPTHWMPLPGSPQG